MTLKNAIEESESLRHIIAKLPLQSAPARRHLMALPWLNSTEAILNEFSFIEKAIAFGHTEAALTATIKLKLSRLRDIHGTIRGIGSGTTPDDIELFELKHFWLIVDEIRQLLSRTNDPLVVLPDTTAVMSILDPEATRVPSFHIYDCYDQVLGSLRSKAAEARQSGDKVREEELKNEVLKREDVVRQLLGEQLHRHHSTIHSAMNALSSLDIVLAKASLAEQMDLICPLVKKKGLTKLTGITNPYIKENIEADGRHFQPVDISFSTQPVLVTGANMGGKTVLLKTVALVQLLTQFGFPVPAKKAAIVPVEYVLLSSGDSQSALLGLSSYGAEMVRIDAMLKTIRSGKIVLALIDEPARSTNPTEGLALVRSIVFLFSKLNVRSLVTTHYSGVDFNCMKLRVKGFTGHKNSTNITPKNIGNYFDYTLEEDKSDTLPHEALRIAGILGVDNELITLAQKYLEDRSQKKSPNTSK